MPALFMKRIIYLTGLAMTVAVAGCEWHEHERHEGGAYDGHYRGYGYETYPPPAYPDYPREHEHDWDHHDYRY
jgi:hypothetical protein